MAGVRVVTINTWKGDGAYGARLAVMARELQALDADIVACQEALVSLDGRYSTPGVLAHELGMCVSFHGGREKVRMVEGEEVRSWSGLATLSRWPVTEVFTRPLPVDPADSDRSALLTAIETPIGVVRVVNTHLTHLRDADLLRLQQIEALAGDPWLQRPAVARLLCGDLNATPESAALTWLRSSGAGGWHVLDAYECGGGEPRATLSERNTNVRAGAGERTLDYICSLAPGAGRHPRCRSAAVVLDHPREGEPFPSDHFGVCVTLDHPTLR